MKSRFFSVLLIGLLFISVKAHAQSSIDVFCSNVDFQAIEHFKGILENRAGMTTAVLIRTGIENFPEEKAELITLDAKLQAVNIENLLNNLNLLSTTCILATGGVLSGNIQSLLKTFCGNIPDNQLTDIVAYISVVHFLIGSTQPPLLDTTPIGAEKIIKAIENGTFGTAEISGLEAISSACSEEEEDHVCRAAPDDPIYKFLWKPVSDSDGKLVILTNPTASIMVNDLEELRHRGPSNGRCVTERGAAPGCVYGKKAVVSVKTLREHVYVVIPDGCNRYDCRGRIRDCGLEVVENSEVYKLKKKLKKLKKNLSKAKALKQKKKIKKLKQTIKAYQRINKISAHYANSYSYY